MTATAIQDTASPNSDFAPFLEIIHKPLKDFVITSGPQLDKVIEERCSPIYVPGEPFTEEVRAMLSPYLKRPFEGQLECISALLKGFKTKKALALIAEMGCGKTLMASEVALAASVLVAQNLAFEKPMRTLVLCPGQLITTWIEELKDLVGNKARIHVIDSDGPDCLAKLQRLREQPKKPTQPEFWIVGINRMKTGSPWRPQYRKSKVRGIMCPDCLDKEVTIASLPEKTLKTGIEQYLETNKVFCKVCGTAWWGPVKGSNKYPPASFIKKYLKGYFGLLVADEVQKFKAGDTIQGTMLGQLASCVKKVLILTGTLSGGKSRDVYYLIQRVLALNLNKTQRAMKLESYGSVQSFVEKYGTIETIYKMTGDDPLTGRAGKETANIRELPGISPILLKDFFFESCAFLRMSDISDELPAYDEVLEFADLPPDAQSAYDKFKMAVERAARDARKNRDNTVLGQMTSALLSWIDQPQRPCMIYNKDQELVAHAPPLNYLVMPKDELLIQRVMEANNVGRKCLIFAEWTGSGALEHLHSRLTEKGLRTLIMRPAIAPAKRLDWIRNKLKTGKFDNLICHPKLVETGLNLKMFPEILFWQTGYSIYVLRQASRRSWRPGQTQEVVVRFFINRQTFQATAMSLIASKLEAAAVLEGELTDQGLVSLSSNGTGVYDLARMLLKDTSPKVEEAFASYRKTEKQMFGRKTPRSTLPSIVTETHLTSVRTKAQPQPMPQTAPAAAPAMAVVQQFRSAPLKRLGEARLLEGVLVGKLGKKTLKINGAAGWIGTNQVTLEGDKIHFTGSDRTLLLVEELSLLGQYYTVYDHAA